MGSVTPLLAIVDALRAAGREIDYLWLGTKHGSEHYAVDKANIEFKGIDSGKLRRYWSWKNFTDIWRFKKGFWQSLWIMLRWRPRVIITAGSFVSVPVVIAGWMLRIPIIVHQLDYKPGLANKIMAKFAIKITVTLVKSLKDYGNKAVWIGSLLRQTILNEQDYKEARQFFGLDKDLPVALVLGGGTGAIAINELIEGGLEELIRFCQIIHLTGYDKANIGQIDNYNSFKFLHDEDMATAYAAADLVICRAGMGTLTELSYLGKPAILIPMPNSHQELNAKAIQGKNAAIVLDEHKLTSHELVDIIQEVAYSKKLLKQMSDNIQKAFKLGNNEMVDIINMFIK